MILPSPDTLPGSKPRPSLNSYITLTTERDKIRAALTSADQTADQISKAVNVPKARVSRLLRDLQCRDEADFTPPLRRDYPGTWHSRRPKG